MKTMTPETARQKSAHYVTKTVRGVKVWPVAYGHVSWLRERKNKAMAARVGLSDYDLAELSFAFTKSPIELQNFKGAKAKKAVNDFLLASSMETLTALYNHAIEQLVIFVQTLPTAKKKTTGSTRSPKKRR